MNVLRRSTLLAAMFVAAFVQQAPAQTVTTPGATPAPSFVTPGPGPGLVGTVGDCDNVTPGGPCQTKSTLVLLDANTGQLIRTIGPVGFTVNGLAWDKATKTLYATTALGDTKFHGLITIAPNGQGTPVNPSAVNFGIEGPGVPVHGLAIDAFGHMVAMYPVPPPPVPGGPETSDTYVRIDPKTGIATQFPNTGINTFRNGIAFGEFNLLWNINAALGQQFAFLLDPFNGARLFTQPLSPPTTAALGDFNPVNNLYYGLNFTAFDPTGATSITVIDVPNGKVTTLGPTVPHLHVITWVDK